MERQPFSAFQNLIVDYVLHNRLCFIKLTRETLEQGVKYVQS